MEIEDMVLRLNRAYKLYNRAIQIAKPYRLHKIRKTYLEIEEQAFRNFEMISLDSIKEYEQFLGAQPALPGLINRKQDAIKKGDYETAAQLRDQEKVYLEMMIRQAGMDPDNHFYAKEGIIFFKHW